MGFGLPCFFHKITGLYCPGCGVTRMFNDIISFDFQSAFHDNPVIFCGLPFIIYFLVKYLYYYLLDKHFTPNKIENIILYCYIVILIIYGIVRNIILYI